MLWLRLVSSLYYNSTQTFHNFYVSTDAGQIFKGNVVYNNSGVLCDRKSISYATTMTWSTESLEFAGNTLDPNKVKVFFN